MSKPVKMSIQTEVAIHICQLCQADVASGLDKNGFPTVCKDCRRARRVTAPPQRRNRRRGNGGGRKLS
jgi:hypothetical protein